VRSREDPAVRRFLRRSLIVRIATLSPAGNPDIIPLYFVTYRGRIFMGTRAENPTVRDLIRNPGVVLLFHGERASRRNRVLRIRGNATFRTDRKALIPVYALFVLKYWLSPGGMWNMIRNRRKLAVDRRYKSERAGGGGIVEVVPETSRFLRLPA
jgi:general stress protein 26